MTAAGIPNVNPNIDPVFVGMPHNLNRPAVGGMISTNTANIEYNVNYNNQPSVGVTETAWNPAMSGTTATTRAPTYLQNHVQPVSVQQNFQPVVVDATMINTTMGGVGVAPVVVNGVPLPSNTSMSVSYDLSQQTGGNDGIMKKEDPDCDPPPPDQ
eukprot:g11706.t1